LIVDSLGFWIAGKHSKGLFRKHDEESYSSLVVFCSSFLLIVICGGVLHDACT
jgi:hypothetical protein